ncbi:hypothetical protein, partial [Methanosphaera sp.]
MSERKMIMNGEEITVEEYLANESEIYSLDKLNKTELKHVKETKGLGTFVVTCMVKKEKIKLVHYYYFGGTLDENENEIILIPYAIPRLNFLCFNDEEITNLDVRYRTPSKKQLEFENEYLLLENPNKNNIIQKSKDKNTQHILHETGILTKLIFIYDYIDMYFTFCNNENLEINKESYNALLNKHDELGLYINEDNLKLIIDNIENIISINNSILNELKRLNIAKTYNESHKSLEITITSTKNLLKEFKSNLDNKKEKEIYSIKEIGIDRELNFIVNYINTYLDYCKINNLKIKNKQHNAILNNQKILNYFKNIDQITQSDLENIIQIYDAIY